MACSRFFRRALAISGRHRERRFCAIRESLCGWRAPSPALALEGVHFPGWCPWRVALAPGGADCPRPPGCPRSHLGGPPTWVRARTWVCHGRPPGWSRWPPGWATVAHLGGPPTWVDRTWVCHTPPPGWTAPGCATLLHLGGPHLGGPHLGVPRSPTWVEQVHTPSRQGTGPRRTRSRFRIAFFRGRARYTSRAAVCRRVPTVAATSPRRDASRGREIRNFRSRTSPRRRAAPATEG